MSKVVKIDNVYLYTAGTLGGKEDAAAKKLLNDAKISYVELAYSDASQHVAVFSAVSTWYWGEDKSQRHISKFPFVHWKEYYDDLFPMDFNTIGVDELKVSSLLKNSKVVVKS
jgi:hypothetical protein